MVSDRVQSTSVNSDYVRISDVPLIDDYFYRRAEAELGFAQKACHPAAVKAHYTLAGYYLDRAYGTPVASSGASDSTQYGQG